MIQMLNVLGGDSPNRKKFPTIVRFACKPCKSTGFSWQSTLDSSLRDFASAKSWQSTKNKIDCFAFLQKSRNDKKEHNFHAQSFAFGFHSFVRGDSFNSPSLAEGARGWVKFLSLAFASLAIYTNLNAITLQEICPNSNNCKINNKHYGKVTNHSTFLMTATNAIILGDGNNSGQDGIIDTFINYGTISSDYNETIKIEKKGYIDTFINYGTISGHIFIGDKNEKGAIGTITNYGIMGSIYISTNPPTQPIDITINNLGIMKAHADGSGVNGGLNVTSNLNAKANNITFTLQNYSIKISEKSEKFNNFSGNKHDDKSNSHLVIEANNGGRVRFKDKKSKILLDFGTNFEFGKTYLIGKVATDKDGNAYTDLGVDFSRLSPFNDIYTITKSGTNGFKVELKKPQYGTIGTLYKSNIRTMNNFQTISDSMIYPHKYKNANSSVKKRVIRRVRKTANLFDTIDSPSIVSGDSFNSPPL